MPYHHIPVTKETKPEVEHAGIDLLADVVELLVMARYMQMPSADSLERLACPMVNIHRSNPMSFGPSSGPSALKRQQPRALPATHAAFQDRCIQPLCHPSRAWTPQASRRDPQP